MGASDHRPVQTTYRGKVYAGEWYVDGGMIHVTCSFGRGAAPVATPGHIVSLPSEIAQGILWNLAKEADPKKPFFSWG